LFTRTSDSLRPAIPFARTSIVRAFDTMAGKNSIHLLCGKQWAAHVTQTIIRQVEKNIYFDGKNITVHT
jgi:hypothetical protein